MSDYAIETVGLRKQYGFKAAADHVSMHVRRGSIYGFVGLNGAGKTTVIRILAGTVRKTSGQFTLLGVSDSGDILSARKKVRAMVETPALYLNLTGEENLKIQFDILGQKGDAKALLKTAGLEPSRVAVKSYSLGMRQRLAIAMALAGDPELLLLDEPTNGLDPEGIAEVRAVLASLRDRGVTVLVSSHILNELARLADTFGFIDNGKLLKEVTADEIGAGAFTVARVSDTAGALTLLGDAAEAYEEGVALKTDMPLSRLVHILDEKAITVESVRTVKRDLETYFLSLLGGDRSATV